MFKQYHCEKINFSQYQIKRNAQIPYMDKQSQSQTTAYKITYTNGDAHRETLREFIQTFDDLTHDEIAKIEKKYKWNGKSYSCTLYTNDEEFGAEEYITHYRALGKQYGHTFLTEFDIEIIRRFSF